jgi:hypothetical protein
MDQRTEMIVRAIATSTAMLGFMILTYAIINNNVEPTEKFKVVDQYEGCTVIRYTDPTNRWQYFLKCS